MFSRSKYYDKNGVEIIAGSTVRYPDGCEKRVYLTIGELLGVGNDNDCYILPLSNETCKTVEVVQ